MIAMFAFRVFSILTVTFSVLVAINIFFERRRQKKTWNNGYCPKCGGKWRYVKEYKYERYYTCENNNEHRCIISYEDIGTK